MASPAKFFRHRNRNGPCGEVGHALTVRVHAVSESAKAKIEAKGGRVEVLDVKKVSAS